LDYAAPVADDLYPGPTSEIPSEDRAKEMAVADAQDAVERVRRWGGEQAAMPLTSDYGDTWFQLRQQNSEVDWPPSVIASYLDGLCERLAAENVVYVAGILGGAYVVDCKLWEHPTLRPGRLAFVGNPDAEWKSR
jgi:hypothetical protein